MNGLSDAAAWVLSDGKAGHENQCLGLAAALGVEPVIRWVEPRFPWSKLPPFLWLDPLRAGHPDGDQLTPPWPDVVIAAGRQTVAPSLAIKSASGGHTFCVQVQDPVSRRERFDLIAAPQHDRITGDNVVRTAGALTRITDAILDAAAGRFADKLANLPRPLVAVLVGGSNGYYRMTEKSTADLLAGLKKLSETHGASLAVTASRRTSEENKTRLRRGLDDGFYWFWDGRGDNPYLGLLALADAIVVTADSVSMVSEACATGKPVYIADLEGGSDKFNRFHAYLRDQGVTRDFAGTLEEWSYEALRDTEIVAEEVARRYAAFASARPAS